MQPRKIAFIELHGTHEECIYSQLLFLKQGGHDTTFFYETQSRERSERMNPGCHTLAFSVRGKKGLSYWRALWALRNGIIKGGFDTVIFNTAHGNLVRDFVLLPFPGRIRFFGTMHGINKLSGSITQKIISRRVCHYLLLNDYLKDNLKGMSYSPHLRFESFYAMYFPAFPEAAPLSKPANELWIGIPGQVEYKRRDYEGLVRAFAALKDKPPYRFLLLGNDCHRDGNGPELRKLIERHGLGTYFRFTGYLDYPEFHNLLRHCDVIAPLIHPGNDGFEKYLIYQISGAYNLAFAYKKPLIILKDFERYEDFRENAVFYELGKLPEVLEKLPQALAAKADILYRHPKWNFEYQCRRYLRFID